MSCNDFDMVVYTYAVFILFIYILEESSTLSFQLYIKFIQESVQNLSSQVVTTSFV